MRGPRRNIIRATISFCLLFSILVSHGALGAGSSPTALRFKFTRGAVNYYNSNMTISGSGNLVMIGPGYGKDGRKMKLPINMAMGFLMHEKVVGVDSKGLATIDIIPDKLKIVQGGTVIVDVDRNSAEKGRFATVFTTRRNLRDATGAGKSIDKQDLSKTNPLLNLGARPRQELPGKSVRIGASWVARDAASPKIKNPIKIKYTFTGFANVKGVSCAKIHGTVSGLTDLAGMLGQIMGFSNIKDAKIKVYNYTIDNCFDVSRGVMVSRSMLLDFSAAMTMPMPAGKTGKIKADIRSKISMKIVLVK